MARRREDAWVSLAGWCWAGVRKEGMIGKAAPFLHLSLPWEHHKDTNWPKIWKESKPQQCTLDNQGYMKKAGMTSQGNPTGVTARWIYGCKRAAMAQCSKRRERKDSVTEAGAMGKLNNRDVTQHNKGTSRGQLNILRRNSPNFSSRLTGYTPPALLASMELELF